MIIFHKAWAHEPAEGDHVVVLVGSEANPQDYIGHRGAVVLVDLIEYRQTSYATALAEAVNERAREIARSGQIEADSTR